MVQRERERERETVCECVCVHECVYMSVCVCVCVHMRESVCVCACVRARAGVCVSLSHNSNDPRIRTCHAAKVLGLDGLVGRRQQHLRDHDLGQPGGLCDERVMDFLRGAREAVSGSVGESLRLSLSAPLCSSLLLLLLLLPLLLLLLLSLSLSL